MYGHKRRDRRDDQIMPYGLTPGQTFDAFDVGFDTFRGFSGGGAVNWGTGTFAGLDVALSAGMARPEEMAGRAAGAVVAQASGLAAWYMAPAVGMAGRAAGAAVGGVFGGPAGAIVGGAVGGFVATWGTRLVVPAVIDPYVRRIGRPINRLVGIAQHRVSFGGFQDTAQAYTMRQRALQELNGSLLNAMQYLGREGQLMHQ